MARKIGNIFTRMWELLVGGRSFPKKSHFFDPILQTLSRKRGSHYCEKVFPPFPFADNKYGKRRIVSAPSKIAAHLGVTRKNRRKKKTLPIHHPSFPNPSYRKLLRPPPPPQFSDAPFSLKTKKKFSVGFFEGSTILSPTLFCECSAPKKENIFRRSKEMKEMKVLSAASLTSHYTLRNKSLNECG